MRNLGGIGSECIIISDWWDKQLDLAKKQRRFKKNITKANLAYDGAWVGAGVIRIALKDQLWKKES